MKLCKRRRRLVTVMAPTTLKRESVWAQSERDGCLRSCRFAQLLPFILLLLAPWVCVAQNTKQPGRPGSAVQGEEIGPGDVIRTDTDLVPVEVSVRDRLGQDVRGLRVSDFKLFADEVQQPISFFSAETVSGGTRCPLDLVFALDVSGSMTQAEMELLEKATATFKEHLSGQRPRVSVISFGMRVKTVQSFTVDQHKIEKAFAAIARDEMGLSTHIFDAIDDGVRLFLRSGRRTANGKVVKRVLIVITDGFATGDTVSARTVIERANAANVSVFSVTMPSFSFPYLAIYGKPLPTILDLSGIVEETGGINVYATDKNYTEALKLISEEILSRYLLAFYPAKDKRHDGNFHKLRIEVRPGLIISQSRPGYTGDGRQ
jgi:Ca-activated chloride channel family protein